MAVNSIRIGSLSSRSLTEVSAQFRTSGSATSSSSQDPIDSAQLSKTAAERAASRERQRAYSTISDAASYISVADNAATEVTRLLKAASSASTQLETEVSESRRADLQYEVYAYLKAVDQVAANATYNDSSIVDAGPTEFSYELDGSDQSSATNFRLSVSDIALSTTSLNLSSITLENILTDPTSATAAIEDAITATGDVRAGLANRADQVNDFAQKLGISVEVSVQNALTEGPAADLAKKIADSVRSGLTETNNLNPLNVQDLLESGSESSGAGSSSSVV